MNTIKKIKANGHDVEITTEEVDHSGHSPAFRITAKVGDSVHVHHHTIGAESGEIADYTAESLQAEIDSVRQHVAEAAVKRHKVRELFKEIS